MSVTVGARARPYGREFRIRSCDWPALRSALAEIIGNQADYFHTQLREGDWRVITQRRSYEPESEGVTPLELPEVLQVFDYCGIEDDPPAYVKFMIGYRERTPHHGLSLHVVEALAVAIDLNAMALRVELTTSDPDLIPRIAEKILGAFEVFPIDLPDDDAHLARFLEPFFQDHPDYACNVFLMMRFDETDQLSAIAQAIRETGRDAGLEVLRADDKQYAPELWDNVAVYMHGCAAGIAVFDEINARDLNPNIALECGFLMCQHKPILLLKDQAIAQMPADIIGRLYRSFNSYSIDETIRPQVQKWIEDHSANFGLQ